MLKNYTDNFEQEESLDTNPNTLENILSHWKIQKAFRMIL